MKNKRKYYLKIDYKRDKTIENSNVFERALFLFAL